MYRLRAKVGERQGCMVFGAGTTVVCAMFSLCSANYDEIATNKNHGLASPVFHVPTPLDS